MKFFKLITFFALFLLCNALEAQTFIYSYTDPCTGLLKSMNVPSNGVTVTYFGQIQTFSPGDFQNGVFDSWAEGVYNSFGGANPCGSIFGVSTSIDIAQSTAINFISIINNISALADLQSAMSGGGSLNTMSAIESAKNSSNKKKDKKKTETTTTQSSGQNSQSQSNSETNSTGDQNQNSNQTNNQTTGTTNTENNQTVNSEGQSNVSGNNQNTTSGVNVEGQSNTGQNTNTTSENTTPEAGSNQTNSNSQNGNVSQNEGQNTGGATTTTENGQSSGGGPINSTGQLNQTLTQSTDIGSASGSGNSETQTTQNSQTTTTGENSTTTTEQPNSQSGQTSNNTESGTENTQQTNTTTENNSQNTTSQEPNSETGQNGQTTNSENPQTGENSTQTTNNEGSQSPGESSQTQNDPNQNGQSSNSNSNGGGNGVGGESPNSNDNAAQNSEDKKTNFLGGTVKSVERSTESNKPQIVLSSDFAGFNFRSGEVDFGGKGTAGYTSLSWDGRRTYGVLLDYTSIIRGPNVTGFYANIAKKRIDLISLTGTFSFYGRGSQYGSLAIGQMWNLNKSKSLKAIYMATASFGNVYGEKFLGTAFIAGGMYDWRVHKRVDVKLMNLFIYAPYVSYYNDILLKSPYVIMPIVGTNIGITKKFKFNVNFGGAYAITENVMNFTLMFGTRFAL